MIIRFYDEYKNTKDFKVLGVSYCTDEQGIPCDIEIFAPAHVLEDISSFAQIGLNVKNAGPYSYALYARLCSFRLIDAFVKSGMSE